MFDEGGYVIAQRYSEWQKKKVRTIVVNSHAKSSTGKSISGAIALAKPYDRIELVGGEYNEAFAIQLPLEIVAAEGEEPHITSRSSTITIATGGIDVYMDHIFVTTRSYSKFDAAVFVVSGNPILYRCWCSSIVIGGNAVALINECTIKESSSGVGITVQDSAGGVIKSSIVCHHQTVCFNVDTRGELTIEQCNIENDTGGDAMAISGSTSSIERDSSGPYASCSRVAVTKCHISILRDPTLGSVERNPSNGTATSSVHILGSPCGVLLTQGAAPTLVSNEFVEGEIGVVIEGLVKAQLKGNIIRSQRRCGILALVEEGLGYSPNYQTLRITGENILDRCRIGIDVQCAVNRVAYVQQQLALNHMVNSSGAADINAAANLNGNNHLSGVDRVLTEELPLPRKAFAWAPVQGTEPPPCSREAASFSSSADSSQSLVCVEGEWYKQDKLLTSLQLLVTMTLQAHPTCLHPSFGVIGSSAAVTEEGDEMDPGSSNTFGELLKDALHVQLSPQKDTSTALREMEQLRGNKGIVIIDTKFANCDACAIRFGRHGHGLVEQCVFEDCGTYAIVADCGAHPLITGCRFLRSRGASIFVSNLANPLVIGNEMASGRGDGIELSNMSRGLIIGNVITTHMGSGIKVNQHSSPLLCANAIALNRRGGVTVAEGSKPTIMFNNFTSNQQAQVDCRDKADAFISSNRISTSVDAGIHIDSCSLCTILRNTIDSNGDGILVERDADPYVHDNDITANIRAGVRACNNALGVFVGNRIVSNAGHNVILTEGACSVFRANRIEDGALGGVTVCNEGHGFFEHNTISSNAVANVRVSGAFSEPEFLCNVISGCGSGFGVLCAYDAGGIFTRNRILRNSQGGVCIVESAHPTLRDNHISCEAVGMLLSDGGRGTLTQNTIEDCYGTGVLSQRRADPLFTHNKVIGSQLSGLQIAPDSLGTFEGNELLRNDIGLHLGSSMDSAPVDIDVSYLDKDGGGGRELNSPASQRRIPAIASRRSTAILPSLERSRHLSSSGSLDQRHATPVRPSPCLVRCNTITNNFNGGILLDNFANGIVEENDIFENNAYGVRGDLRYTTAQTQTQLQKGSTDGEADLQRLFSNLPHQSGKTDGLVTLCANKIHRHKEANIFLDHFDGESHPTIITENEIYGAPYGVCVANSSSACEISKNNIHTCLDGCVFVSGGCGTFSANHIHDCVYTGVYVSDFAKPDFKDGNCIEKCGVCGVLVDVTGQGLFLKNIIQHCTMGVIVFCGPTAPFQVSHAEMVKARLLSSTPTFMENTIEENELHGVLLLSVISGCPLRSRPVISSRIITMGSESSSAEVAKATAREPLHDVPTEYHGSQDGSMVARDDPLCATFEKNLIRRNRVMGIFHDRFEHWDFSVLDAVNKGAKSLASSTVKNAHGGYEVLLGTSMVLDNEEHRRQRQLKQVNVVENVITDCSFGVGVGNGCHPYLQRNRIHNNNFFGLFLRFGSAISAYGNEINGNGIAGVYAANGAKGYIAKGVIESNNGWCRPESNHHRPRDFEKSLFQKSFFSASAMPEMEKKVYDVSLPGKSFAAWKRAYEQLTSLTDVHLFSMTDALRFLAELVAASSSGITIATGCVPSSVSNDSSPSASPTNADEWRARLLGGVALTEYADVSTADGGLGVWVQVGSRVTIRGNRIDGNRNAGVLITRGVLQHHSILHKAFPTEAEKGSNPPMHSRASSQAGSTADRNTISSAAMGIFSMQLEAPLLACEEPGALFTPLALCTSGVLASVKMAASIPRESLDQSLSSFAYQSLMLSAPAALLSEGPQEQQQQQQQRSSLYHALIAENDIRNNRDGVHVEVFHSLQAAAWASNDDDGAVTASNSKTSTTLPRHHSMVTPPLPKPRKSSDLMDNKDPAQLPSTASPDHCGLRATAYDAEVMDAVHETLNFTAVVEANTITNNTRYGVYAVHVSTVACGPFLETRESLRDTVGAKYEGIRAKLSLRNQVYDMAVTLPFRVQEVPQKVGHAYFRRNSISANQQYQAHVTSRYVALSRDGEHTLLQLDTAALPASSNYSSQVLLCVPVMASLLSTPPPGVLLWEENRFHDATLGVHLCGYLGPNSARFERNNFVNIAENAIFVQGQLASITLGKGNFFERNGVNVRLQQQMHVRFTTTPAAAVLGWYPRTRIFRNIFKAVKDTSILFDGVGMEAPLLYRNEFYEHRQGTAALYVQCDSEGGAAVVQGNLFAESYAPVLLVGRNASNVEKTLGVSQVMLLENRFMGNHIGAIICNGAYPILERNIFDHNERAGLEVMGAGTRPRIRECVFLEQKLENSVAVDRSEPQRRTSATLAKLNNSVASPRSPQQDTLSLQHRNLFLPLLAANTRVLGENNAMSLPAGLLVGPFAEPVVESCAFVSNDIGVDAFRDDDSFLPSKAAAKAHFSECLFTHHHVCGVLVRGSPTATERKKTGGTKTAISAAALAVIPDPQASPKSGNGTDTTLPEATLFEHCVFTDNSIVEGRGDALIMEAGYALFRENIFAGTVVGKLGGRACFTQNCFIGSQSRDSGPPTGSTPDSTHRLPQVSRSAAITVQKGGQIIAYRNWIAHREIGLECAPGAEGILTGNHIVKCVKGMVLAPNSYSDVHTNKILGSAEYGAVLYGGHMADNEIFTAPTGIVVQPASLYKTVETVTPFTDDGLQLLCNRNRITDCAKDGLLIAASGVLDGNIVSHCKTGIRILAATKDGPGGVAPLVKNSAVYDNGFGVCMTDDSESTVKECDIFDNEAVGVMVSTTALGMLQGNRISSAMDQGALEISIDARVKMLGNVVRNQFSPAFQHCSRSSRAKEYQAEQARIEKLIREVCTRASDARDSLETVARDMRTLQREITSLHSSSNSDLVSFMAGSASLILRSVEARSASMSMMSGEDVAGSAASPSMESLRPSLSTSNTNAPGHVAEKSSNAAAVRRRSSSAPKRQTLGGPNTGMIPGSLLPLSRTLSHDVPSATKMSLAKTKNSISATFLVEPTQALIHVFSNAESRSSATAVGKAVAGVLVKPPLSLFNFISTISTSTSRLLQVLGGSLPLRPALCIVVVDTQFQELTSADRQALQQLHNSSSATHLVHRHRSSAKDLGSTDASNRGTGSNSPSLFFILLPKNFILKKEEDPSEQDGMSLADCAAAHPTFTYTTSVEEVIESLHQLICKEMKDTAKSPLGPSRARRSVAIAASKDAARGDDDDAMARDDSDSRGQSTTSDDPLSVSPSIHGSPLWPESLTVARVGALFSQLTPEALGIESPKAVRHGSNRRRKSSAVNSGEEVDSPLATGAARRSVRNLERSRGSLNANVAGSGFSAARHNATPTGSRANRHSSVSSKKSNRKG